MTRTRILAATLLALPLSAAGAEQEFNWSGKVASGQAIELKGVSKAFGDSIIPDRSES